MGQRLNIEIIKNGETLANAYYHWGAYTSSSLELTKLIIENIDNIQCEDEVIRAVRLLEFTGALITSEEIEEMHKRSEKETFKNAESRNDGLISITKEGIESTRKWEEGRVEIHLDEEFVDFNVFWKYDKKTYLEDSEKTGEKYQKLPLNTYNYNHISFDKFNQIADETLQMIKNRVYETRLENDDVLGFIE
jgi:hypothetical protein